MLQITHITEKRSEEWNALAARGPSFTLMQSWEWGAFKEDFGWRPFRVAVEERGRLIAGAQVLVKSVHPRIFSMAYVPRGPVGDWTNRSVSSLLLDELRRVARDNRAIFLRIEPPLLEDSPAATILQENGFKCSPYTNQARATIMVDLSQGTDALMARLREKTRYNIRYAAKHGIIVRIGGEEDLPMFHKLMHTTGRRGGFTVRSLDYYTAEWQTFSKKGQFRLFIAIYHGEPIAVNMSAAFGECAAYLHGGSSGAHSNLQPNYLLMWEAMRWAYSQNCKFFDLWGIPDEVGISVCRHGEKPPNGERTDGLWGVYRFKRGFSNTIRLFTSAHDYAYFRFLYALIMNKFINTNTIERIVSFIDRHKRLR